MSKNKVPTIPFVLPLYHKMEQHLEAVSRDSGLTFKLQYAVDKGLEKLRKYSVPAKVHHSYILGTSMFPSPRLIDHGVILNLFCNCAVVLHPCLRSHWFASTAQPDDEDAQKQAVETAEVVFRYVAESYHLKTSIPPALTILPKSAITKPALGKTPSFLASACAFQRPATATSSTIPKRTPKEELADELDRYLRFDAMPMLEEELEVDGKTSSNEPSREEVLLNPLLWWKVSMAVLVSCTSSS
jgi:hypothetical protein